LEATTAGPLIGWDARSGLSQPFPQFDIEQTACHPQVALSD
jgi:hypothetical protein